MVPISKRKKIIRGILGFLFSPIDAFYGLIKGTYYFLKSPRQYFWTYNDPNRADSVESHFHHERANVTGDRTGKWYSGTLGLSRFMTIALVALCVLGFLGCLAAPIPGITPLYSAGVLGILEAVGITIAWATVARSIGALIGGVFDFFFAKNKKAEPVVHLDEADKLSHKIGLVSDIDEDDDCLINDSGCINEMFFCNNNPNPNSAPQSTVSKIWQGLRIAVGVSLLGEVGAQQVQENPGLELTSALPTPTKLPATVIPDSPGMTVPHPVFTETGSSPIKFEI